MGILFDAINDVINCGTNDDIMTENGALTMAFWCKPNSTGEGGTGCLSSRGSTGLSGPHFVTTGTANLRFQVNGSTTMTRIGTAGCITFGTYQHILLTWDGSTTATNVHFYVNGSEISAYNQSSNGSGIADNSGTTLQIGNRSSAAATFDGIISDVAYWNTELNLDEIKLLASSRKKYLPLQVRSLSLKRYFPLDDFPGGATASGTNSIRDRGPISVHGTPVNSPVSVSEESFSYS